MELLTRHSRLEVQVDDQGADAPVALSARVVQALAVAVALTAGVVSWATPGVGALATVVVVVAIGVAACAQWPARR